MTTVQFTVVNVNCMLQAGYYCNVCECILRDSSSYLDHINGKYHNRALGMSMTVERSTAEDVKRKFEELKKDKDEPAAVDSVLDGKLLLHVFCRPEQPAAVDSVLDGMLLLLFFCRPNVMFCCLVVTGSRKAARQFAVLLPNL